MRYLAIILILIVTACDSDDNVITVTKDGAIEKHMDEFNHIADTDIPAAERTEYKFEIYGKTFVDNYHWLRDPAYPEVNDPAILAYIEEENKYSEHYFKQVKPLQETIFNELRSMVAESDYTVPVKYENYEYYHSIDTGEQFWKLMRRHLASGEEQVVHNPNAFVGEHQFFNSGVIRVSHNEDMVAFSNDVLGSESYDIIVQNIDTGENIDAALQKNGPTDVIWHHNNQGFFYVTESDGQRFKKVMYHTLGDDIANDKEVFVEHREAYAVMIGISENRGYLLMNAQSFAENEAYYLDLRKDDFTPKLIKAVEPNIKYSASIDDKNIYILINDQNRSNRLLRANLADDDSIWEEIVPQVAGRETEAMHLYAHNLVLQYTREGLANIEVRDLDGDLVDEISFEDEVYSAGLIFTKDDYQTFFYTYDSLRQPTQVWSYNFITGQKELLKQAEVAPEFDASKYTVQRVWIESRDGVRIPVSILYRADLFTNNGQNPLYVFAYGSYGLSYSDGFSSNIFSLVDRGYVFAMPHVRGESYLGQKWHDEGRLLNKKNTFNDVIDVIDGLIERQYTSEGKVVLYSGSAGGLLTGYCANERPELFDWIVVRAPFVDVVNTLLSMDATFTTSFQIKEFGDVRDEEYYKYIMTYDPYMTIERHKYPKQLVTTGLNDPRVGYWEALKYVAKLRDFKTDKNLLLLSVDMNAGHFGKVGRYDSLQERAKQYAMILSLRNQD